MPTPELDTRCKQQQKIICARLGVTRVLLIPPPVLMPLPRSTVGTTTINDKKNAAEYFQAGIDSSLNLLAGRTGRGDGGGGIMEKTDALDLAGTYNRLGLALREAGTDAIAAKEAFVAGLAIAPEDLALLVNGGAAHQV